MTANAESLVVEFKKEVAKMREREATDLEIQSMLEFVEQLTHWRGDVDRESLINALRKAARKWPRVLGWVCSPLAEVYFPGGSIARISAALSWQ
jgi:hypothetical protein